MFNAVSNNRTGYYYNNFFQKNTSLKRTELIDLQNKLITRLVSHAYTHTKYYRDLFDANHISPNDITCANDLWKLPALTKSIIRQQRDNMISDDKYGKNLRKVSSSGSTGNPITIYKSSYYEQMSNAAYMRNISLCGFQWWKDRSLWLWYATPPQNIIGMLKQKSIYRFHNMRMINTEQFSESDFDRYARHIKSFLPKLIFGKGTVLLPFAEYLKKNSIHLDSVKSVLTCSTKLEGRNQIAEGFQANVFDFYSTQEIYAIAVESSPGVMRVADDNVALNISKEGEFYITALHSYGFPLINYKVGDYGDIIAYPQSDNSSLPFSTVSLNIGRVTELFLTADKTFVSGGHLMTHLAEYELGIVEHQIEQTGLDTFIVRYVPNTNFNIEYTTIARKLIYSLFGEQINVIFKAVQHIPCEKGGKRLYCKRTFDVDSPLERMTSRNLKEAT